MAKKHIDNDTLIAEIIKGIEEVKGQDITNGTSNTQVNAIVGSIQKIVSKALKDKPWHIEGSDNAEWVLMDYVNVVVHVFQKHIREEYDIEALWGDAKSTIIPSNY